MIRRLRRRHCGLTLLCFASAALLLGVGLLQRRPGITASEVPARLALEVIDTEALTWLIGTLEGTDGDVGYRFLLLTNTSRADVGGIVARIDAPAALPDVLLHWAPARAADSDASEDFAERGLLPRGARLLGALSAGREVVLPLPVEALELRGRLILTTLAHGARLIELDLSLAERPGEAAR